jgi:hypothetical protein
MSSLSSRRMRRSFGPTIMAAALVPTLLLLGACKAPPMDEQEAVGTHAQKAAEEAAAPANPVGKATEAPPVGNCDATQVQSLIGQAYTDDIGAQAQQDASARDLRVLKPDDVTTMEFVGERLNIELDEKSVITGLRCG